MNNYDQSSKGVNLDLFCIRDENQARYLFEEYFFNIFRNENSLTENNYSRVNIFLFGDHLYDIEDINNYKFTKLGLLKLIYSQSDLLNNDESKLYFNKSLVQCNKSELIELINDYCEDLKDLFIKFFQPKFEIIQTRGYSQGDYVEIIIPHDLENKPDQEMIDHLFWDRPVYIRLEIDQNDFCFNDFLKDDYNYDKQEILEITKKEIKHSKKEYILNWLDDNLPEDL